MKSLSRTVEYIFIIAEYSPGSGFVVCSVV